MDRYSFVLASEEQRGASKPNIVRVGLDSDADALIFKDNLELGFAAQVVSINKVLSEDYSLPYPSGTNYQARITMWTSTAISRTAQARIRNVSAGVDVEAAAAALIAAGILLPDGHMDAAAAVNIEVIRPGAFA